MISLGVTALANTKNLDAVQEGLAPLLRSQGYSRRGRTFLRELPGGIAHTVNLQGGVRSFEGRFTLNLGVFLPECYRFFEPQPLVHIQEVDCEIRARIGNLLPHPEDTWWQHTPLRTGVTVAARDALSDYGLPFLTSLLTREAVIAAWRVGSLAPFLYPRGDIAMAIVLAELGSEAEARSLLHAVAAGSSSRHLRSIAQRAEAHLMPR